MKSGQGAERSTRSSTESTDRDGGKGRSSGSRRDSTKKREGRSGGKKSRGSRDVVSSLDVLTDHESLDTDVLDDEIETTRDRPRRRTPGRSNTQEKTRGRGGDRGRGRGRSRGRDRNDKPARTASRHRDKTGIAVLCDASGLDDNPVSLEHLRKAAARDGAILSARAYGGARGDFTGRIDGVAFVRVDTSKMDSGAAHVRMVADAVELCYTKPGIDTFVLVAGDDALAPLAVKLRELDKRVVAVTPDGKGKSLAAACDDSATLEGASDKKGGRTESSRRKRPERSDGGKRRESRQAEGQDRHAPRRRDPRSRDRFRSRREAARARKAGSRSPSKEKSSKSESSRGDRAKEDSRKPSSGDHPKKPFELKEAMLTVRKTVDQLARRFGDRIWPSTLRDNLNDRHGINERDFGFSNFDEFLREAEKHDALVLQEEPRTGKLSIYSLEEE